MNIRVVIGLLIALVTGDGMALQVENPAPPSQTPTAAAAARESAPASQVHNSADAQLQASVRKAIANDPSLSDDGHHVNVIVAEGAVVLRGKVKNDAEKTRIDSLVRQVSGVKELTNELDVKPLGSPG
ncbi:BON domain-containing protein [Dyella sp. C11]|uniref:BON domain-containing protein n=1 Tax=Dyella sp. C11 TaxID=2126991 RepID=UPI000D64C6B9|nr:BON domain-containing protein [Dyella sp. C11]